MFLFDVPGLRTLCLAVCDVDKRFYSEWSKQYQTASTSVVNRQQLVEQAAERIEKVRFFFASEPLLTAQILHLIADIFHQFVRSFVCLLT